MIIFYLKSRFSKQELVSSIEKIFNLLPRSIGHVFDNRDYLNYTFRYEYESCKDKDSFFQRMELYPPNDLLLTTGIYNELIFGIKISKILDEEIIITDHSDDPYEWILIKPTGDIFRVEEDGTHDGPEIKLELSTPPRCLSYEKVLQLFHGKEDLLSSKEPKTIPSALLESCIIY